LKRSLHEPLLKEVLECWRCRETFSNLPKLKEHSPFVDACKLGQETLDRFTAMKARSKNPEITPAQLNPGAWAPEVSVQRVAWNNGNGLGNCQLLVSGMASGLCRIDWVSSRWFKRSRVSRRDLVVLRHCAGRLMGMGMLIWMTLRVRASFQIEVSEMLLGDASARHLCPRSHRERTLSLSPEPSRCLTGRFSKDMQRNSSPRRRLYLQRYCSPIRRLL